MSYAFFTGTADFGWRYQTPHQRLQSGIDAILHVLDWIPVRLAGVVYALLGHGGVAGTVLPRWRILRHSRYRVLTRLAQFSLAREPHTDKVKKPQSGGVDGEEGLVCGGGDYCVAHHLWGIELASVVPMALTAACCLQWKNL